MGSEGGVYAEESCFEGADDVSSSEVSASADHLVVMVHGILGRTDDWKFAANQFVKAFTDKAIVHCSECNMNLLTLDGVDVMGERLAEEVVDLINKKPGIKKVSFIAHSVGGLVARYTIGRLYRAVAKFQENLSDGVHGLNAKGTVYGLKAMNFITVATPHLGSRGNKQVPFLFGLTAVEKVASLIIHLIFGRTGRHLFLTDNDGQKPPLLQRMVEDSDPQFMSALEAFERRVAYSNVGNDRILKNIVGWRTSSIRRNSELPKWDKSLNEKYPHVVYEEYTEGSTSENCSHDTNEFNNNNDVLEENLVVGLTRLSWERVDVSFHSSKQRFAAHSIIQVKNAFMYSEGADVIQHMIDHFLI